MSRNAFDCCARDVEESEDWSEIARIERKEFRAVGAFEKHSTGPWHVEVIHAFGTPRESWSIATNEPNRHGDGPEHTVAHVTGSRFDRDLIVASPELLAALEVALLWLVMKVEPMVSGTGDQYDAYKRDEKQIHDAIAKAKGYA